MVELILFKVVIICVYRAPSSNLQNSVDSVLKELVVNKKVIFVGHKNVHFLGDNIDGNLQSVLNSYGLQPIITCINIC